MSDIDRAVQRIRSEGSPETRPEHSPAVENSSEGIGAPVRRWEDGRLVTGRGRFVDDIAIAGCLHAVFVRSPFAHARLVRIDKQQAEAMPGVVAVLTGMEAMADGLGEIPCVTRASHPAGESIAPAPRPVLAREKVRFPGDPVAIVVAQSRFEAENAAETVQVDYDPLPAVPSLADAAAGAPVWHALPGNRAFAIDHGNAAAVARAFAEAERIVAVDLSISRVTAAPVEPRGAIAISDAGTGRMRLITGTQGPHLLRQQLARHVFRVPVEAINIESPDVGGSFGLKNAAFPELAALLWASRRTGRPVRWTCSRSEGFLADDHARDNFWHVELAFDRHSVITGLKATLKANLGAYLSTFGAHCPLNNLPGVVGPYRIGAALVTVEGYYTNSSPVAAYRGAGRPEASYVIERAIDVAARRLGLCRVELRRRNLVPPSSMPWTSTLGAVFDSGDFPQNMEKALGLINWQEAPQRREQARRIGRLRGFGLAHHIESAGSTADEMAELRFGPDGGATMLVGTPPQGQGHETMLRQFAHELLGLKPEKIFIVHSETDAVYHGQGTFGSRAAAVTSAALVEVARTIVAKAKLVACDLLEADAADIEFEKGRFAVVGTDRSVTIEDVAKATFVARRLPPGVEPGLWARHIWRPQASSFPSGCHACELEIDPDTGHVTILDYVAVEDCGTIVNPLLLAGQLHGGIAQGIGQALMEQIVYDGSGQLISGSFMDYAMPRAADFPKLRLDDNPHPTSTNPLGIKGAGESGTVGSLPAVMNAVVDALAHLGVEHMDMPATPERIWETIRKSRAR